MSKTERTKALIVEKTAPIFNKKGFSGTSLNDMVAATGLTKGSIYGNFAGKDEVALAVFDYNFKKLTTSINKRMAAQHTAKDKLMVYVDNYQYLSSSEVTDGGCPILNTAVEADDTHPQLRSKAAAAILSWKNTIVGILEEGKEKGEIKDLLDTEQFALTMIAMIEGAIMISRLLGSDQHIKLVMDSMRKMIEAIH